MGRQRGSRGRRKETASGKIIQDGYYFNFYLHQVYAALGPLVLMELLWIYNDTKSKSYPKACCYDGLIKIKTLSSLNLCAPRLLGGCVCVSGPKRDRHSKNIALYCKV